MKIDLKKLLITDTNVAYMRGELTDEQYKELTFVDENLTKQLELFDELQSSLKNDAKRFFDKISFSDGEPIGQLEVLEIWSKFKDGFDVEGNFIGY